MQTILPVLLPRRVRATFIRERLELPDGDFLDLDWLRRGGAPRVAILAHGLEGSSTQTYIRGMASTLAAAGWDVLAWNFRGCSGEPNRLPRAYHSGETEDLRAVITRTAAEYPALALAGFSLGGKRGAEISWRNSTAPGSPHRRGQQRAHQSRSLRAQTRP